MKHWKYAVWAVLLAEILAFGTSGAVAWGVAAYVVFLMVMSLMFSKSERWKESLQRIGKANPLSPWLFNAMIVVFTIAAIGAPYQSGEISYILFVFVATVWALK